MSIIASILRETMAAARAKLASSPHVAPTPELVRTERELYGPRPGDVVVYGWHPDARGKRRPGHVGILSSVPGWRGDLPASVLEARRWVGQGIYHLGAGGRDPGDGTPFDRDGRCDCSGFACHCLGIDRKEGDKWWNTTAIVLDGATPGDRWDPVPLLGVDLRRCTAIHCHGGRGPAVSETSAALWHQRGVVARLRP